MLTIAGGILLALLAWTLLCWATPRAIELADGLLASLDRPQPENLRPYRGAAIYAAIVIGFAAAVLLLNGRN